MAKIFLRKKISPRISEGHPWVFENEIGDVEGDYQPGEIIPVFSSNGSFIGRGYINPKSKIRVRLLSRDETEMIDDPFFITRIRQAWALRQKSGYETNARIVFGESDMLPGLIIDKFEHNIVLQTLTLGMDCCKAAIVNALNNIFPGSVIYERNDAAVRLLEGLELKKGFLSGTGSTSFLLRHKDITLITDMEHGPRTGLFWEQWWIAEKLHKLASGASVLDVFCASGCCGLFAAKQGATKIVGIDEDGKALNIARRNVIENKLPDIFHFENGNAFDLLKSMSAASHRFQLIILDPPSLAKNKDQISHALNGYKELHFRAMSMLHTGGFLLTTCSTYLITEDIMLDMIQSVASDRGRRWRIIEKINQAPDHPVLWNLPSGNYFKGYIIQVF